MSWINVLGVIHCFVERVKVTILSNHLKFRAKLQGVKNDFIKMTALLFYFCTEIDRFIIKIR